MSSGIGTVDVAIVGAGLAGSCAALELASHGLEVALIDQDPIPMNRASLRNEGKIHLGFVYAVDESLETGSLQLRGALTFGRLLRRWLGSEAARIPVSTPFHYSVSHESILSTAQVERYFVSLASEYERMIGTEEFSDYLGTEPGPLFRSIEVHDPKVEAARFETAELAVHTDILAERVRRAIEINPRVSFLGGHRVDGFENELEDRIRVLGYSAGEKWTVSADSVINASWDSQIALDRLAGLDYPAGWLHRLKYRVIADILVAPEHLPSLTIVSGPFGDVVVRRDGTAYLSWYPAGLRGWSNDEQPPRAWTDPAVGSISRSRFSEVASATLQGLKKWHPVVQFCRPVVVDAGVIVAHGKTDIDDPASGLHRRTTVGVRSTGRFFSVNPGKLTTAPYFALKAARAVMGQRTSVCET